MASHVRGTRFSAVMVRARAALCSAGLLAILVACSSNAPPQAKPVLGTVYSTQVQPNYSRAGIKVLSHQVSSLDDYPALRVSATTVMGKVFHETQFFAGVHGNDFVLTITDCTPTLINQIAGTVRFL